jgi:hypothetical protein
MKESNMPKADFITSILLICFGGWVTIHSYHMPRFENLEANPFSVPGIVPGILGTVIVLLSGVVLIRSLRRNGYRLGITRASIADFFKNPSMQRMVLTLLICMVYGLILIGNIDYYLSTFLFVTAFLLLFQYRRSAPLYGQKKMILASLVQALLTAAIVGAVFRYLFLVVLP